MSGWDTIRACAAQPVAEFRAAAAEPRTQQEAWLSDLLARNAESAYGRRHGFAAIRNSADYRRAVPIVRHEDIAREIDQIAEGAVGVLTAERVIAFEETSGSTTG